MTWSVEEELEECRVELARMRRELDTCERAESEHRVADREAWLRTLEWRRAYISDLELQEQWLAQRLVAEEESRAEAEGERRRDEEEVDAWWGGGGGS
jgi:hypothetical protein